MLISSHPTEGKVFETSVLMQRNCSADLTAVQVYRMQIWMHFNLQEALIKFYVTPRMSAFREELYPSMAKLPVITEVKWFIRGTQTASWHFNIWIHCLFDRLLHSATEICNSEFRTWWIRKVTEFWLHIIGKNVQPMIWVLLLSYCKILKRKLDYLHPKPYFDF